MARNPLDRSAAFTALLELNPEGFGKSSDPENTTTITTFLDDFYQSGATNMYAYCREWLDARDDQVLETIRQAEEAQAAEAVPPAAQAGVPEDPDKPWQVTAQVCRSADGWQSSRQVPAFTIPRALAHSKQDAEAKAREIINPYREPYHIHMDVTTAYITPERQPEARRHVMEGDEQQPWAVQEGPGGGRRGGVGTARPPSVLCRVGGREPGRPRAGRAAAGGLERAQLPGGRPGARARGVKVGEPPAE